MKGNSEAEHHISCNNLLLRFLATISPLSLIAYSQGFPHLKAKRSLPKVRIEQDTDSGIFNVVKELQPIKAASWIVVTLLGISKLAKEQQP